MTLFLVNLLLSVAWGALTGVFAPGNLAFGYLLGYLIMRVTVGRVEAQPYFHRPQRILRLLLFFLWELMVANLRVARAVLGPERLLRPAIVAVHLDASTDLEIAVLVSMVTLTPGTVALDLSEDRRTLYVHCLAIADPAQARRDIKEGFEKRILEAFR